MVPGRDAAVAAARARIVISAVTAAEAADVAAEAAGYLRHGQIFFDINSASPATKTRSAQLVEAAGARFVEGAGAAPLAGLLKERTAMAGKRVGLILSGGNIDRPLYASIIGQA